MLEADLKKSFNCEPDAREKVLSNCGTWLDSGRGKLIPPREEWEESRKPLSPSFLKHLFLFLSLSLHYPRIRGPVHWSQTCVKVFHKPDVVWYLLLLLSISPSLAFFLFRTKYSMYNTCLGGTYWYVVCLKIMRKVPSSTSLIDSGQKSSPCKVPNVENG